MSVSAANIQNVAQQTPELSLAEQAGNSVTLAGRHYHDQAVFEAERTAVFYKSWLYAGHASQLAKAGDYITTKVLDQEVFLIRGNDGEVRAFYNACAHRAHPLVSGAGQCDERIVCPYHAWAYALDGRLQYARGAGEDFTQGDIKLSGVRTDWLLDFVFINLDPNAAPLADVAPGLAEDIAQRAPFLSELKLRTQSRPSLHMDANWKLIVDNYIECYHCAPSHPGFSQVFDVARTEIELSGKSARQWVPRMETSPVPEYPLHDDDAVKDGVFWFLWPNTGFAMLPGAPAFSVSRVDPLAPDKSHRHFWNLATTAEPSPAELVRNHWLRKSVGAEDIALCEAVQRGVKQRGYVQGRYIADVADADEKALHAFHRHYLEALGDA
jgi:carnitine monooxygenase subunit